MKEMCYVGFGLPKTESEKDPLLNKGVLFKYPRGTKFIPEYLSRGMSVIFMLRNPAAVLISRHPENELKTQPKRWIDALKVYDENKHNDRIMLVKFEKLLTSPNEVQTKIAEKFNLNIKTQFEECWKSFDSSDRVDVYNMRGIKPIDLLRLSPWKQMDEQQKKKLVKDAKNEELIKLMETYGYDSAVLRNADEA